MGNWQERIEPRAEKRAEMQLKIWRLVATYQVHGNAQTAPTDKPEIDIQELDQLYEHLHMLHQSRRARYFRCQQETGVAVAGSVMIVL